LCYDEAIRKEEEIMNIEFKDVFPNVFSELSLEGSDVWKNSLLFEKGKKYLVQAESGGGKSSMLSYIYGERQDYQGSINFENININSFKNKDWTNIRNSKLSIVFQGLRLFGEISVLENIQLKNSLTNHKTEDGIRSMLDKMEIGDKIDKFASTLSFGQRQKVAVIRSLCQPFEFLLLDEPFSHLDERNRKLISELILTECKSQQSGLIVTTLSSDNYFDQIQKLKL
jgi:ABC-type lipoprotein export system ATPase subunit